MFQKRWSVWLCAFALVGMTAMPALAVDSDGDGVPDGVDVCCNTPPGVPVDSVGRPIADLDQDCDVDMVDFGIFQISMTGPMTCSPEVCDGLDNDCNCIVDDVSTITCGTGACQVTVPSCVNGQPNTCTPGTPSAEVCDGIDNDCNGIVDDGAAGGTTWYEDLDSDGYGNAGNQIVACSPPPGWVSMPGDCDDTDPSIHPGATEVCNAIDDDCNGIVDDGATGGTTWYEDLDSDGYGNAGNQTVSCSPPPGWVSVAGDCDDTDPNVYPGATEVCNGIDDDCDGDTDEDTCPAVPNASGACNGLGCTYTCDGGYGDCNASWADGCEVNVTNNVVNCGACGNVCPQRPNATRTCVNSTCSFVCNAGYVDCNGNSTDGCEVNIDSDANNCGACNTVCNPGDSCVNGQCVTP